MTLVLGGARSGKSAVAEGLAARTAERVTYIATTEVGDDPELASRIADHRDRRPAGWETLEVRVDLAAVLTKLPGTVLVDSLGPWVTAFLPGPPDSDGLCRALRGRAGHTVVVSEEVGLSVHPSSALGRRFRDQLGLVNQAVAAVSDDVLLVVAGRVLPLVEPIVGR